MNNTLITIAVGALLALPRFAVAQQVKLLEGDPIDASSAAGDEPQIILPESGGKKSEPAPELKAKPAEKKSAPAKKAVKPAEKVKPSAAKTAAPATPTASKPEEVKEFPAKFDTQYAPAKAAAPAAAVKSEVKPAAVAPAPAAAKAEAKPAAVPLKAEAKPTAPAAAKAQAKPALPAKAANPAAAVKPAEVAKPVRPVAAKEAVKPAEAPAVSDKAGMSVERRHNVTKRDTLWDLSGKYYGDPYKWGKIYNANLNSVKNPDLIYPKEELIIPGITDEVKPVVAAAAKPVEITGSDTVSEGEMSSSDLETERQAAAEPVSPVVRMNVMNDDLNSFERNDLSSEMPKDQKEWSSFIKVVPDNWKEDGVVTSKIKASRNDIDEGLGFTGETVVVRLSPGVIVRKGDYMTAYIRGGSAFDKKGKRIGKEIQPAGMLEVVAVEGGEVKARVVDASSSIRKGLVVKLALRS